MFLSQRVHPFPFRTRKLSSAEPKILAWRRAGTIGHCRHLARATVLAAKGNMGMHSDTPLVSLYFYSSLAQSVERVTVNHDVAGSSPAGGSHAKSHPRGWLFAWLSHKGSERTSLREQTLGSSAQALNFKSHSRGSQKPKRTHFALRLGFLLF